MTAQTFVIPEPPSVNMTDLERAQDLANRMEIADPVARASLAQCIEYLMVNARREGAEAERAGQGTPCGDPYSRGKVDGAAEMRERAAVELAGTSPYYARLVRALPLTPEEPAA